MVTNVLVADGQGNPEGHCSQCGRIWTLETEQGVCQWCGKLTTCQTRRTQALRSFKSSRSRKRKQTPVHSNGYDHLNGEWLTYYKVAIKFEGKAISQDREDLRHNIIVRLADVSRSRPLTLPACYRVASYVVSEYWRNHFKLTAGLDCPHCSTKQRHLCRQHWLYENCPKAIRLESLDREITDAEGNITSFGDTIADDKAIDIGAWLDANEFLKGCPKRLYEIAVKLEKGTQLDVTDRRYICDFRQREKRKLL